METLARFALDDFAGDAAFFEDDSLLISTLHNSIHVFSLPSSLSSDSTPALRLLRSISTIHAPARPLLWTSRFSQSRHSKEDGIRIAGGSLLGEVLIWDVDPRETGQALSLEKDRYDAERDRKVKMLGRLRRLSGHRGAIFTAIFSPVDANLLATGSDDRTLRIWDLSSLSSDLTPSTSATDRQGERSVESFCRTLWGHEGRVWRIDWVDEKRLVSVAEDATCRLWEPNSSTASIESSPSSTSRSPTEPAYTLLLTWRDGHDGRTIWSVGVADIEAGEGEESGKVVFSGGADGTIRRWTVPSTSRKGKDRRVASPGKLLKGSQIKSFVIEVDPSTDQPIALSLADDGSFYLHGPSTPVQNLSPFHSSPSFANSSASLHLHFAPPTSIKDVTATVHAFSNKGTYLLAQLSISSSSDTSPSSPSVEVVSMSEHDLKIKTVFSTFDSTKSRVAIWERATWKIHILDLTSSASSPPTPLLTIDIQSSADGSTAPTSFLFLNDQSLLLVGDAEGQLSLYSLSENEATSTLMATVDAHSDGVQDLRRLDGREGSEEEQIERFEIESVGRDGMRKVIEITNTKGCWKIQIADERWIAKGPVEKILAEQNGETRYFALVDTRAGVFDCLGRMLYTFESPGKQVPSQLVQTRKNGLHYYRLLQGQLHHQSQDTSSSSPIISPGLHGREIRAVKMQSFEREGVRIILVATAAENGVLAISELMNDNSLRPLYINRFLPSSLKLTFSSPISSSNGSIATLYACGTRELVTAFQISVSPSPEPPTATEDSSVELRVLSKGMVLAEAEGGEVRTMDITLIETGNERESLILAGYSNGKLRLWKHSESSFECDAETEGLGKCILSAEVAKVTIAGKERCLAISGQSDGTLSIRDLTSFAVGSTHPSVLPNAFYTSSPHQSGINGLSVSVKDSLILVATAGDDNAVSLERIELSEKDGLLAKSLDSTVLSDAHASTIQGLNFLSPNLLASSSVEQRLNLYSLNSRSKLSLNLIQSTCLDVADCSAQDAIQIDEEGERWKVVVAGIGVEVVEVLRA
ncbi:hypothetical protein JCM5353_007581 [Sporobolomyces roseus]